MPENIVFGQFSPSSRLMKAPHILVVCTANICRSPVVEALLRVKLTAAGLNDWTVSSAGTWASEGNLASQHSVTLMTNRQLDIQPHRSQPVTASLMAQTDLILCMETGHVRMLKRAYPEHKEKIFTLRQMVQKRGSVKDPYGGSMRQYERMVAEVEDLIDRGLPRIKLLAEVNFRRRGEDG